MKDNEKALQWTIKGADLGFVWLSGIVYRLHQACGEGIPGNMVHQVKRWLPEAAKKGSLTALADLKSMDIGEYEQAHDILRAKYWGIGFDVNPKCLDFPVNERNIESLLQANKRLGGAGITGQLFGDVGSNLLHCMAGCGSPMDEFMRVLNDHRFHLRLDDINFLGDTALVLTTRSGHLAHVRILLQRGSDVMIVNKAG
jgi:hypothetical protein